MPARPLIIPVQKRTRYAEGTIETILAVGDDIELTLAGRSAKNARDAIVHPGLKMMRPTPGIGVVGNVDIALSHAPTPGAVAKAGRTPGRVWQWPTVRFAMTKDERIAGGDTIATAAEILDCIPTGPKRDLARA